MRPLSIHGMEHYTINLNNNSVKKISRELFLSRFNKKSYIININGKSISYSFPDRGAKPPGVYKSI
jgi:hypothetical protein